MNLNQGESQDFNFKESKNSAASDNNGNKYEIIVVSRNQQIHQALLKTLRHFSLNGKEIQLFNASSLQEAQLIAEQNKQLILVIIDNCVQVNGSYNVFVDYVRNSLGNQKCCITFKENLIISDSLDDFLNDLNLTGKNKKFRYALERLLELARMVMVTADMEDKLTNQQIVDSKYDSNYFENNEDTAQYTKDKLYKVLAHDLKEPVGNIKVLLDFLTNEPELLDQKSSKDLLQRVRESANNIHDMLEDFLFWSRMFKQEVYFNPAKIDISEIVRENVILLKSTAASKNIRLQMKVPQHTVAFADEYMITTVMRNLLYNAIKFTGTGGDITVNAIVSDGMVEINVEDNGIGIPEEDLDKLFKADVFFSTAGTEEESGAGLGLVLCKDFIERNGGKIIVRSTENIGSTFSFTLPAWSFAEQA